MLERAKAQGALTVAITNEADSTLKLAEVVLLKGYRERVAATKTYTGQMLMLYLLAYALGARFHSMTYAECPPGPTLLKLENDITTATRYRFMDHGGGLLSRPQLRQCLLLALEIDGNVLHRG
ncbi:MAG: hypothetical protein U0Q16_27590 [Bryobacteraceae bacterium]